MKNMRFCQTCRSRWCFIVDCVVERREGRQGGDWLSMSICTRHSQRQVFHITVYMLYSLCRAGQWLQDSFTKLSKTQSPVRPFVDKPALCPVCGFQVTIILMYTRISELCDMPYHCCWKKLGLIDSQIRLAIITIVGQLIWECRKCSRRAKI